MKKYILLLFLGLCQFSFAQELNAYKYVVVPLEYKFLKERNQYQLAELAKFLFETEGFEAYLEGDVPEGLGRNNCNVLHANINEDSGLFVTRLKVQLRDCNNKIIFTTEEGTSREKDYGKAYHEALREAFKFIAAQDYVYQEKDNVVEVTAIPQKEDRGVEGEVVKSIPEPQREKGTGDTASSPVKDTTASEYVFVRDNAEYYLKRTSSGFNFFQKQMAEPFAALLESSTGDSYIYSSVTSQGMASFTTEGDLIVEVLDPETGSVTTTVYKQQVQ